MDTKHAHERPMINNEQQQLCTHTHTHTHKQRDTEKHADTNLLITTEQRRRTSGHLCVIFMFIVLVSTPLYSLSVVFVCCLQTQKPRGCFSNVKGWQEIVKITSTKYCLVCGKIMQSWWNVLFVLSSVSFGAVLAAMIGKIRRLKVKLTADWFWRTARKYSEGPRNVIYLKYNSKIRIWTKSRGFLYS